MACLCPGVDCQYCSFNLGFIRAAKGSSTRSVRSFILDTILLSLLIAYRKVKTFNELVGSHFADAPECQDNSHQNTSAPEAI